jgi:hypothetical protein
MNASTGFGGANVALEILFIASDGTTKTIAHTQAAKDRSMLVSPFFDELTSLHLAYIR